MRRFFFQSEQRRGDSVFLGSRESHHISRVLRLKEGEQVELCDHDGFVFSAEIIATGKRVELALGTRLSREDSAIGKLSVGQGGIKTKNMEFILQKCTELGVDEFHPFVSARSQGNLIQQYQGKGERWRRIIAEACKQCERSSTMELYDIHSFQDMIDITGAAVDSLKLLFWEKEKKVSLHDHAEKLRSGTSVVIIFGPEGGFTEEEIETARKVGWQTVGLGTRILRSETAAIAATSLVQHHRGEM
ncbi:MAG: RsmE family RNA methyltransferase [Desulfocapsaceae bacterium]|nr:RsmE family RNA methyltransferase [Desulfocapsaceae bacterium]